MALKVFWTDFAKQELKNIFDYYKKEVSLKIASQIVLQIAESTLVLTSNPEIGQVEILLKNRPQKFRYIITTNYKIIYWVNKIENRIEISDVFDTRQNPVKIDKTK